MSMRKISIAAMLVLTLGLGCGIATAADAAKAKTPAAAAKPVALTVTVVSVSGSVQKLVIGDGKEQIWQAVSKGDQLPEKTIIRTGFRSSVVLKFADRGEVTVNSAGKMGISEFRKQGNLVKAKVGLKYGTMRASVAKAGGPNDFTVATPVATLSVRGTGGLIGFASGSGLGLVGKSGTWNVAGGGRSRNVGKGESTNSRLAAATELAQQRRDVGMGATGGGQTPAERLNLRRNGGGQGLPLGFVGSRFTSRHGTQNTMALLMFLQHSDRYRNYFYGPHQNGFGNGYSDGY